MKNKKVEIQEIGLDAIKEYLLVDIKDFDPKVAAHLLQKAKLGMSFEREMNLSQRSIEGNQIRIFKLTSENKSELKKLIKQSLPQYTC